MLAHADPHAVDWIDDSADYGEERIVLIGQCRGTILTVVFTIRAEAIRIISARKATRHERDHYYRQTPP